MPRSRFVAAPIFPFVLAASWESCQRQGRKTEPSPPRRASRRREPAAKNIVETAVAAGSFTVLATALEKAGLIDTLEREGPFTVFAPVDDAFERLPDGAVEDLLADEERLAAVLRNHVVQGPLSAAALAGVGTARTVDGGELTVDTSVGVRVAGAYVVQPDVRCSNGIVHAVDSVLLPDESNG